ncbi:MAG: ABC transporter ATP-binding protein [Thermoprotei archaeon]|uniref:ABC transporter ATP-binding protein n=1 Tax=Fervidicoccus fontis TaxID=683846 RepID=A0A7J3SLW6_9CREN|nr:ABC transporter ATP-binding protein [Thermoprotei archaeon]
MDELVSVKNISKAFGNELIISDVSFTLHKGEALGLVGPNGAGKSTMLRIIAGLVKPDKGDVRVNGRLGYTPQENLLLPWFNLKENILLPARLLKIDKREAERMLRELSEALGISEHLEKKVREVSGGTARKAALARSLITSPDILLLDEPYVGLDVDSVKSLQKSLMNLRKETGIGMIIVSHQLDEMREISDRALVLSYRPARVVREIKWGNSTS